MYDYANRRMIKRFCKICGRFYGVIHKEKGSFYHNFKKYLCKQLHKYKSIIIIIHYLEIQSRTNAF